MNSLAGGSNTQYFLSTKVGENHLSSQLTPQINVAGRRNFGLEVTNEKIALVPVWREAGELFDSRERAALAWAETVTQISVAGAPDDAYAAVADHFAEKELVDLTIAIGLMNAYNRLAISFRAVPAAAKEKAAEPER